MKKHRSNLKIWKNIAVIWKYGRYALFIELFKFFYFCSTSRFVCQPFLIMNVLTKLIFTGAPEFEYTLCFKLLRCFLTHDIMSNGNTFIYYQSLLGGNKKIFEYRNKMTINKFDLNLTRHILKSSFYRSLFFITIWKKNFLNQVLNKNVKFIINTNIL